MDWDAAINRNREALLRFVAMMVSAVGLVAGRTEAVLPRHVYRSVLLVLRPLESALRRLIVVEARGVKVPVPGSRASTPFPAGGILGGASERAMPFQLFDSWPRVGVETPQRRPRFEPRIMVIGWDDYGPERVAPSEALPPSSDESVNAARLCRRLEAVQAALAELPKQAKRMARAMARRALAKPGPGRVPPMRPGWPPGHRARQTHPVDAILVDCHALALYALRAPDTS